MHLSNLAAAHTVHSLGCRLQVTSQFGSLNTSVFTGETANHAEMISKEHILSYLFRMIKAQSKITELRPADQSLVLNHVLR